MLSLNWRTTQHTLTSEVIHQLNGSVMKLRDFIYGLDMKYIVSLVACNEN